MIGVDLRDVDASRVNDDVVRAAGFGACDGPAVCARVRIAAAHVSLRRRLPGAEDEREKQPRRERGGPHSFRSLGALQAPDTSHDVPQTRGWRR